MSSFAYLEEEAVGFLRTEIPVLLARLDPDQAPAWGLMTPQHMVEHLMGAVLLSVGHYRLPVPEPPTYFEVARVRLLSDAPFTPNTHNPRLPLAPGPLRLPSLAVASAALLLELDGFFQHFEQQPAATPVHPLFGPLSFAEWRIFHFKHFGHHFLQFGLLPQSLLPRPIAHAAPAA